MAQNALGPMKANIEAFIALVSMTCLVDVINEMTFEEVTLAHQAAKKFLDELKAHRANPNKDTTKLRDPQLENDEREALTRVIMKLAEKLPQTVSQ